jgi:hypothetical protein
MTSEKPVEPIVILGPGQIVTGVREWSDGQVILTGSSIGADGTTTSLLYAGPLAPTDAGGIHVLPPQIEGVTVTSSTFYGPDTYVLNSSLGSGNVRAVGTCVLAGTSDVHDHGMVYEGPPGGGGGWSLLDVPDHVAGGTVWNTIPHSTMGNLIVGDYDLKDKPGSANAFLYDIDSQRWQVFDFAGCDLTTAYGIWQDSPGSSEFTICGGTRDGQGINRGFLVRYSLATRSFGTPTLYNALNMPGLLTHFEGITGIEGGYNLAGLTAGASLFATVPFAGGKFGAATWGSFTYPGAAITTGNTVYQQALMGLALMSGTKTPQSYAVDFKD